MDELSLTVPLSVNLPRKRGEDRKMIINLNNYRNWHYIVSNQCKHRYSEIIKELLSEKGVEHLRFDSPVNVRFQYFKPTKRISDKANVYSIQSKFCYDALVQHGLLEDDNDDFIKAEVLLPTVHDPNNPRVEFLFTTKELL